MPCAIIPVKAVRAIGLIFRQSDKGDLSRVACGRSRRDRLKRWVLLFPALVLILLSGCQAGQSRIEGLLITADVFPTGWSASPEGPKPPPSAPFGGIKSIKRTLLFFQSTTASAYEGIELYSNRNVAINEFAIKEGRLFREDKQMGSYSIPEELSFHTVVADQYHFACTRPSYYPYPFLGCLYLARYESYIVEFRVGWRPDIMSATQLRRILETIDAKMVGHAG